MLATELPGSTMREKERYTQVLFEELGASSVLLVNQAYAALTAFAENTGVVVDLGHETIGTHTADTSSLRNALDAGLRLLADITPVIKGQPVGGASRQLPIGGRDMAKKLAELLAPRGIELSELDAMRVFEQTASVSPQPLSPESAASATAAAQPDAPATATLGGGRTVTVGPEAQACVEPIFSTRSYAMDGSGVGLAIAVHEAVVR